MPTIIKTSKIQKNKSGNDNMEALEPLHTTGGM